MASIAALLVVACGGGIPASPTPAAPSPSTPPGRHPTIIPTLAASGTFRGFPFPQSDTEPWRPAIDRLGRVWFGATGRNALVVFDPGTQTFRYLTPPHGRSGIMSAQVASDDTIWFAEQSANYLGHYSPATGHYQLYPLLWLTIPAPGHPAQLPPLPNELALDLHGDVWFTALNADSLGRLDPQTGLIHYYPLAAKGSVQPLYPYGVTIDPAGMVWFTESGTKHMGRLDPTTGALQLFAAPDPHAQLMEIAGDAQGSIWVTSFTPGLLYRLTPATGKFTSYTAPFTGSERSPLYGLLVTRAGDVWVTIRAENVIAHLAVAAQRFNWNRRDWHVASIRGDHAIFSGRADVKTAHLFHTSCL